MRTCETCKHADLYLEEYPCNICADPTNPEFPYWEAEEKVEESSELPKEVLKVAVRTRLRTAFQVLLDTCDRLEDLTYAEHEAIQELLDEIKGLFQEVSWGRLEV